MTRISFLLWGLAATSIVAATQALAGTNLVQNPSFETGDLTDWTQVGNWVPSYNFVSTDSIAFGSYDLWDGNYADQGYAGVSQTLATTNGQQYQISLAWLATGTNSGGTQLYQVLWDGNLLGSITDSVATYPTWTTLNYSATGTGSDTLTIEGYSNSGYNITDDVSVVASGVSGVPETSTWAMMLLGFVGLGYAGYRKVPSLIDSRA